MADPEFRIPAALPVFGQDLPVDVELTGRVMAAPPAIAPSCSHTRATIKQGDTFVVTHTDGGIHPGCECGQGVYFKDTRFLSGLTLALAGRAPIVLSASTEHNFFSRVEAMNDAFDQEDGPTVRRETMHLARTRVVDGGVRERLEVTNYNAFPVRTTLTLELRSDFKDIFEVRGYFSKSAQGTFLHPRETSGGAELLYRGADGALRHTSLGFSKKPTRLTPCSWTDTHETGVRVEWQLELPARGGHWAIELDVVPCLDGVGGSDRPDEPLGMKTLEKLHAKTEAGLTRLDSPHPGFAAFLQRGVADMLMLMTPTADGPYPTAGIPWYTCPFGRDGLITALQSLPLGPDFAKATLRFLARHQGTRVDAFRDEEPGKILHELREGELAALGDVPHTPYYGTIDATPLWLILLSETYRWTGDRALVESVWPNALRAMEWIDVYGDADGDGFVEYARKGDKGLANQGWKDSHDSVIHPDATLAEAPIALAEVQGYVYDAKRRMAELAEVMNAPEMAQRLRDEAKRLKKRFNEAFWVAEEGYYAIALDGHKQQVRAKTSNPGHALWSGLIESARVSEVVSGMMASDMFNGWGIRTMSSDAPNYNPLSYHNGTVWPHDCSVIAKGMADHGHKDEANRVLTGLYDTSRHFDYHRLPELFCGFERSGRFAKPVPYPVACSPQ
ncbi:MAG TPA: amylo-alpha-1,6-glucosidase, partial [Oscillatoriaceae cyanobacterium]